MKRQYAFFGLFLVMAIGAYQVSQLTLQNLLVCYLAETSAQTKYIAYAASAEADGFAGVSRLFRAASASEDVHAANLKNLLASAGVMNPTVGRYDGSPGASLRIWTRPFGVRHPRVGTCFR
jgi:hypothetical protein